MPCAWASAIASGLQDPVDRGRYRDRPPVGHDVLEVVPLEVLEHQIGRAALERPDIEHTHDVLALDASGSAPFAHEAPDDFGVSRPLGQEHLDGDASVEPEVHGGEDHGEPSAAAGGLDHVLARDRLPPFRDVPAQF